MDAYTTPPHLAIRVLWWLRLGGQVVEPWFYPTAMYLAVLIRVGNRTEDIRQFSEQEVALRWAEAIRRGLVELRRARRD